MTAGLVVRGDLGMSSGGFLYDRRLVGALRAAGDQVEVIEVPWEGALRGLSRGFDARLRSRLASWRGDVLLQDELAHPALLAVNRRLRRSAAFPIVAIVHHLRLSEGPAAVRRPVVRALERAYLRSVDGFVFNGQATRASVEELRGAPARCVVAPPGGDRLGAGVSEQEAARRALAGGDLRVLFVGNLIPRKGLVDLLSALSSQGPSGWRLTVAGSREMDPGYARRVQRILRRRELESRVEVLGHVDDVTLAALMRSHHVLAVPSVYEGFGIAYLEAMGFGLVPIGTTAGGAAEIIDHGRNGFLVAPGDVSRLGDLLSDLGRDRARLARLAGAARRRSREFPGWAARMAAVRQWLHTLVTGD